MTTVLPFEEVVTRWVTEPRGLEQQLEAVGVEGVRLEEPFRHDGATWTAAGRLRGPRTKVELQITSWPNGTAEVTVRPAGRRHVAWSASRERRYFDAAHNAATQIADTLASVA